MNIHEYQAKELLRLYKVATPDGKVAQDAEEARMITKEYGGASVVKAQIHAGGRGKGGGVKFANDPDKAADLFKAIFGMQLVTKQTGAEGRKVHTVFISKPVDIARELYLSFLVDRGSSRVTILASTEGGVEIEEVAEKTPEKIVKVAVDPALGLSGFQARQVAFALGLEGDTFKQGVVFLQNLYRLFMEKDCSMVEINPLVITKTGEVTALDAKIGFDDNALFRHPDILAFRDLNEEAPEEIEASKFNLNFIKLDGTIGCMVNGAGLAMATLDIIKLYGGSPANFLDVGGGASKDQVQAAFKIILTDPNVKGILVNIFGGIMDCNTIATGVVAASRELALTIPLVVRLEGNNVAAGKKTLAESGLKIESADTMADAAQKIVKLVA
jgi:succinyl-CoA synthetase beta subunit